MIVQVCAIPTIVKNASQLYKTATKTLGQTLPDSVIRASFFYLCYEAGKAATCMT
jgi:hypothetical protein